jgi:hypothetical protein
MKKIKILFLSICLALCANHCRAIDIFHAFKYAKEYISEAADITYIVGEIYGLVSNGNENNTQSQHIKMQPTDKDTDKLFQTRQIIADLIIKHADGEIGGYGLPIACDAEIKKLISLPGGQEVLKELQELFEKFFKTQKEE